MSEDDAPKSAYELAMERLRKKDQEAGVEAKELTDAQRRDIAEARNFCEAKLAEREVLYQSARAKTADSETLATLEREYRIDRDRLTSDRDSRIDRIRRGA